MYKITATTLTYADLLKMLSGMTEEALNEPVRYLYKDDRGRDCVIQITAFKSDDTGRIYLLES